MAKLTQLSSEEKVEILQMQRDGAILMGELQGLAAQYKERQALQSNLATKYTARKKELEDKHAGVLDDNTLGVTAKPSDQLDKCAPTS